jgi:hypothetical protein
MPSLEMEKLCDTDLTTRRRKGACAIAFSPGESITKEQVLNRLMPGEEG